jgi:hypothetical protein
LDKKRIKGLSPLYYFLRFFTLRVSELCFGFEAFALAGLGFGLYRSGLQTEQLPPSLLQCLQASQLLQALQFAPPLHLPSLLSLTDEFFVSPPPANASDALSNKMNIVFIE